MNNKVREFIKKCEVVSKEREANGYYSNCEPVVIPNWEYINKLSKDKRECRTLEKKCTYHGGFIHVFDKFTDEKVAEVKVDDNTEDKLLELGFKFMLPRYSFIVDKATYECLDFIDVSKINEIIAEYFMQLELVEDNKKMFESDIACHDENEYKEVLSYLYDLNSKYRGD